MGQMIRHGASRARKGVFARTCRLSEGAAQLSRMAADSALAATAGRRQIRRSLTPGLPQIMYKANPETEIWRRACVHTIKPRVRV
jgi:hypothetical protein